MRELRTAGILELIRRQKNLRTSINKLKAKLRSGARPDLELARAELLSRRERELAEVEQLIDEYRKNERH